MKHFFRITIVTLFWGQTLFAQDPILTPRALNLQQSPDVYSIPGSHLLRQEEMKIQQYLKEHPEVLEQQRMMKRTAWNFQVGDQKSWWATNIVSNSEYAVPSTCRAVGVTCYIFVEDSLWNVGRADQAAVDSIRAAWDVRTPAFSTKGIYQLDVETFGTPPDVDQDPKIIILILDIKDGFVGSGGYVAGYFFSINQFPDGAISGRRSNVAEIYYIDGNPLNLRTSSGLTLGMQTSAHEFQHMIHWNNDPNEITFINESCSQVAELVCGYPYQDQSRYTDNTDVALLSWTGALADYSRATRWMLYVWNQFPNGYLRMLVKNRSTGAAGMDNAFAEYGTTRRFGDLFVDWLVANQVNDPAVNARYAYTFTSALTKPKATTYINPNVGQENSTVNRLAADYLAFTGGSNLSVTFTSSSSTLLVKAVKVGATTKQVVDVPLNTVYTEPAFGTTFSSITFIVINTSQSSSASYSYQASGTSTVTSTELKWDDTEPIGFLRLSPLDTVCVTFDAVAGGRLDSIRVALRRAGSVTGGVWRFTGDLRPSPLGARLAGPVTVSTPLTPPVVNAGQLYPYEIPYPNWRTLDLRAYNVRTDGAFAVGFWLGADTSTDARVMVTRYPGTSPYHSFTFLQNPSGGGGPNWYYLTVSESEIYIYLIRAYVGFSTEVTPPLASLLLSPTHEASRQPTTLTLSWSPAPGATSYRLQVSTRPDFSTFVLDDSSVTGTSREVGPLAYRTAYYWRVIARNTAGVAVSEVRSFTTAPPIPNSFALRQNYPNPFNPGTTIEFDVPVKANVRVAVFDLLGRLVAVLTDREYEPGTYDVRWDVTGAKGASISSGVYVYWLESEGTLVTRRMVVLK